MPSSTSVYMAPVAVTLLLLLLLLKCKLMGIKPIFTHPWRQVCMGSIMQPER